MATTSQQDQSFVRDVISSTLLEDTIAWIASNMNPEDVFSESDLRDWATANGFVKEDDASVLRTCVQDVEASQAVYLRLEAPVVDLIRAVESVQDWGGTRVGEKIEAVESVLNYRY